MSFIGRRWRVLDAQYDIVDSWPILFTTLTISLLVSVPSLIAYTYFLDKEHVDNQSYYYFDYTNHWYGLRHEALIHWQLWRVITNQFVNGMSAEILIGSLIIAYIHPIEREIASTPTKCSIVIFRSSF